MEFISDLLQYEFLQRALLTAIVVGIISGILGSFIILRGLSLMGDAISHAVLPGVAISYMLGINFIFGAFFFGMLTAFGIGYVQHNSRIKVDAAIGIIFSAFLALGIILIAEAKSATDLTQILFGNILSVQPLDLILTLVIAAIVLVTLVVFYKEFFITTFDPTMARVYGVKTNRFHYLLMTLLTLVTVASLQTVGVILVVALLVTPAATAYLLTNTFRTLLILSSTFGVISAIAGLYFSFSFNVSSGASIVLSAFALFILAFLFSPKYGLMRQKRKPKSTKSKSTPPQEIHT